MSKRRRLSIKMRESPSSGDDIDWTNSRLQPKVDSLTEARSDKRPSSALVNDGGQNEPVAKRRKTSTEKKDESPSSGDWTDSRLQPKLDNLAQDRIKDLEWRKRIMKSEWFKNLAPFHMYISPEPEWVVHEPKVEGLPSVHVRQHKYVKAKINGMSTHIFLDSGTNSCFVREDEATRLGLLAKVRSYCPDYLYTFNKVYHVKMGYIDDEVIELEGGFKIQIPITVMPLGKDGEWEKVMRDLIIFGQNAMTQYKGIQVFEKYTSYVYFKAPEILGKPAQEKKKRGLYVTTHFEKSRSFDPLSTLIDSGAKHSIMPYHLCEQMGLEMKQLDKRYSIAKAKIHMSGRCCITELIKVDHREDQVDPIVLGLYFLASHQAVIDYEKDLLYLHTRSKRHKVQLGDGLHQYFQY